MNRKSLFSLSAFTIIGLVASVGMAFAQVSRPYVPNWSNYRVQGLSSAASGWTQVNIDGFGEPTNTGITTLEVFNGQLYAGASNWDNGGRVWRTDDGTSWTPVSEIGFGSAYTNTNPAIIDMIEFDSQLYAGIGWDGVPGQIWRSPDGTNWDQVEANGFGDANHSISTFTVFTDTLYAATGNNSGLQIWRSSTGDSLSWTNVVTGGFGYSTNRQVTGFREFNNALYAAIESNLVLASAQVWRTTDGITWTPVITDGFGDLNNYSTGGFASFDGYLYLGTRNDVTGAQLWRSNDGATWIQVIGDGLGDSGNVKIESLFVFEGHLYAVTYNEVTGMEVWRSSDGTTWRQANADGFGDSNNYSTLWSNATVAFNNRLFIGTWNDATGGEVWMMLRQVFLPLVLHNYQ